MKPKSLTKSELIARAASLNEIQDNEVTKTSADVSKFINRIKEVSEEITTTQTTIEATESSIETADSSADVMENFAKTIWKKVRVNLDQLFVKRTGVRSRRVPCYGQVVFTNREGKKVATGTLTDLSEKSGGFVIEMVYVNVNDILYLEFLKNEHFDLAHVKVMVKRIQEFGARFKIGVEFVDATAVFQERLTQFLGKWRNETIGFDEIESRW
jgi:hypothetical protein